MKKEASDINLQLLIYLCMPISHVARLKPPATCLLTHAPSLPDDFGTVSTADTAVRGKICHVRTFRGPGANCPRGFAAVSANKRGYELERPGVDIILLVACHYSRHAVGNV